MNIKIGERKTDIPTNMRVELPAVKTRIGERADLLEMRLSASTRGLHPPHLSTAELHRLEELESDAYLGLMQGAEGFDPERKVPDPPLSRFPECRNTPRWRR